MKVQRAADCLVYVNGKIFAYATSVQWSMGYGRRAIYGIDQHTPQELASGQSKVSISVSCVRARLSAGIEGAGIAALEENLLNERYFFLQVVDRITDTVILQVPNCSIDSQSWSAEER